MNLKYLPKHLFLLVVLRSLREGICTLIWIWKKKIILFAIAWPLHHNLLRSSKFWGTIAIMYWLLCRHCENCKSFHIILSECTSLHKLFSSPVSSPYLIRCGRSCLPLVSYLPPFWTVSDFDIMKKKKEVKINWMTNEAR